MYVSRGMAALPVRPGTRMIRLPISRHRVRGMGLSCPPGQTPTNMYDGSVKCCGGPTAESDPCSYMNMNAGYQQTQAAAQADAIAGAAGPMNAALLRSIQQYPQNVQQDAIDCVSNPGATFTDAYGMPVTCPSESMSPVPGINVSIYTPAQIAARISGQSTPANPTPIDLIGTTYSPAPPGSFSPFMSPPQLRLSADPLRPPAVMTAPAPASVPARSPAPSTPAGTVASAGDIGSQVSSALTSNVSLGGFNLPVWGLAAAGLALFFFMGKR